MNPRQKSYKYSNIIVGIPVQVTDKRKEDVAFSTSYPNFQCGLLQLFRQRCIFLGVIAETDKLNLIK